MRRLEGFYLVALCVGLFGSGEACGQTVWSACGTNPSLQAAAGAWDAILGNPEVLLIDGEYRMWYHGAWHGDGGDGRDWHIGAASATDPCAFTRRSTDPVLPNPEAPEALGIGGAAVVYRPGDDPADAGSFQMWYAAWSSGNTIHISYAESTDGDIWQPVATSVLVGDQPWERESVRWPGVTFDGATYHMWYEAGPWPRSRTIGYATSEDGIEWVKHPDNPVLVAGGADRGSVVSSPSVRFDAATATFEMWYYVRFGSQWHVAYATSMDGAVWEKHGLVTLDTSNHYWTPSVVFSDGTYHMWFQRNEARNDVDYATSEWTVPRASFTAMADAVIVPVTVTLDAGRSAAPQGAIASYAWDLGDGNTAEGPQAEYTYETPGDYRITLSVTDASGNTGSVARVVRACSDVDQNGIPDCLQVDCNENRIPDTFEVANGGAADCNQNDIPDECDLASQTSPDKNRNDIPDSCEPQFVRGDCDGDGEIVINDGIHLLNFLFVGQAKPGCKAACDAARLGILELTSAVRIFEYLFLGKAPPPSPFPECGLLGDLEGVLGCDEPPANCQ